MEKTNDLQEEYYNTLDNIPFCDEKGGGCEVINNFLETETEVLKGYEKYKKKKEDREKALIEKQKYLDLLRKEIDKVVVEMYILRNNT